MLRLLHFLLLLLFPLTCLATLSPDLLRLIGRHLSLPLLTELPIVFFHPALHVRALLRAPRIITLTQPPYVGANLVKAHTLITKHVEALRTLMLSSGYSSNDRTRQLKLPLLDVPEAQTLRFIVANEAIRGVISPMHELLYVRDENVFHVAYDVFSIFSLKALRNSPLLKIPFCDQLSVTFVCYARGSEVLRRLAQEKMDQVRRWLTQGRSKRTVKPALLKQIPDNMGSKRPELALFNFLQTNPWIIPFLQIAPTREAKALVRLAKNYIQPGEANIQRILQANPIMDPEMTDLVEETANKVAVWRQIKNLVVDQQ